VGFPQQPVVSGQSTDFARTSLCLRIARPALGGIDLRKRSTSEECAARLWRLVRGSGGLCDHEDFRDPGKHRNLFSRLLAVAERQGAGQGSATDSGDYGVALRSAEIRLYLRPAAAEFCGSLRAVRHLGEPDVLGVPVGNAAADRSSSFGAQDIAQFV